MSNTASVETAKKNKVLDLPVYWGTKFITEDKSNIQDNTAILGRVKCVASKIDEPTFNNTVYSRDLWETLLESKDFNERMKRKLVMGNLDHPACFLDNQFDVLTEDGWKTFNDIKVGDNVFTLGENDQMELNPVEEVINSPYRGRGYRFYHRSMDFSVTPEHRFLVEHRYGKREYVTAEEIFNNRQKFSHSKILKTSTYDVGESRDFVIPRVSRRKGSGPTGKNDIESDLVIKSDIFCAFLGIWLSEGSISKVKYSVKIHQKKENNIVLIRELLGQIGLPFNENKSLNGCVTFVINDQRLHTYLKENCGDSCYVKHIPAEIKKLPASDLNQLVEWFIIGDGRNQKIEDGYSANRKNLFSVSKVLVDDLHELVIKCGGSANISLPKSPKDYMFAGHLIKVKNKKQLFQLNISSSKYIWLTEHVKIEEVQHDGNVYCLTVKNSNFYFRKGTISFWTGNSPKQKAKDATHTAVKVWLEGNEVWCEFEIFDTPDGRILWTLLRAGVILGVSSRSTGTDEEKNGKIYLNSKNFKLMGWDFVVDESAFGAMFKEFSEDKKEEVLKVINEERSTMKNTFIVDMVEHVEAKVHEEEKIKSYEETINQYRQAQLKSYEETVKLQEEKVHLEERLAEAEKVVARLEDKIRERDDVIALKERGAEKYREEIKTRENKVGFLEEKLSERDKVIEEQKAIINELRNRKSISIEIQKIFTEEKNDGISSTVARNLTKNKGK